MKTGKLFLIIPFLILSYSLLAQHWQITELTPMPESISNNAVCEGFVDGVPYVYTFGGIDSTKLFSGIHNRSYRYNTQTAVWESIPPLPDPMGKIASSANRVGNIIYIIGGYYVFSNGGEASSDRVHRYDIQSNTFLSDGAPIPVPIDDQVQVVYKDSLIYVISGWSDTQNVNNVQIYDPANDQWQEGTSITWVEEAVFGAAGAILGDTIYFYGGATNGDFSASKKLRKGVIQVNDPTQIVWSATIPDFGITAYRPAATTSGNKVYFLGGSDETYNYNGIAYNNGQGVNPNNRSFSYHPGSATHEEDFSNPFPMDLRGIANVSDTTKYLAGGMLNGQIVSNKLWKLEWIDYSTSASEIAPINNIELFPNPVRDELILTLPQDFNLEESLLEVFDQNGIRLMLQKLNDTSVRIETSEMMKGHYFLKITQDKTYYTVPFQKQ